MLLIWCGFLWVIWGAEVGIWGVALERKKGYIYNGYGSEALRICLRASDDGCWFEIANVKSRIRRP